MSERIRLPPGAAVLLVLPDPTAQAVARVLEDDPPRLAIEAPPLDCRPQETVTLMFGPRTGRYACRATVAETSTARWVLHRRTPWVRFDARRSARFPVRGTAQVVCEGRTVAARPLDISEGGCAVAVGPEAAPAPGKSIDLALQLFGYAAHLRCTVVGTSPGPDGSVCLHLHFENLAPHQRAFVRAVVAAAAEELRAAS
ncbi:hypothetical protein HRbin29_00007 [bacterium HR29]|nr:hypothetical protein HRbin29_00007 [bacterium HR29]